MAGGCYRPEPLPLWRVPDALARLRRLLPTAPPGGAPLERFLPNVAGGGAGRELQRRAALASTLLAGLDLSRGGVATLVQREALGPILLAATAPPAG